MSTLASIYHKDHGADEKTKEKQKRRRGPPPRIDWLVSDVLFKSYSPVPRSRANDIYQCFHSLSPSAT
jgi:hypothetical protein